MHQQRRDGSIFDCYINEQKQLCTGNQIFSNCILILSKLSTAVEINPKPIPSLPSLNEKEVNDLQQKIAYNKAISFDGITHQFIRTCNWEIIKDIWNEGTFNLNKKLGWIRFCPLNKCHPDIPNYDQFRPLAIISPLFKLLELRFHNQL